MFAPFLGYGFKAYTEDKRDEIYKIYAGFNPNNVEDTGKVGYTFYKINETKRNIARMIFWIFDFSVPELSHLTVYQRAHLHDNIFIGGSLTMFEINKKYSFGGTHGGEPDFMNYTDSQVGFDMFNLQNNDYSSRNSNANIPFSARSA